MKNLAKICFIGSGQMAEAIINGVLEKNIFKNGEIFCVDINLDRLKYFKKKYNVNLFNIFNIEKIKKEKDFIKIKNNINFENMIFVLSVKPNNSDKVCKDWKEIFDGIKVDLKKIFVISIIAGKKIEQIQKSISSEIQIMRVMPNTPVILGEGAIAYSFSQNFKKENKHIGEKILSAIGKCYEVKESELDAITALSGSGPAYIFYLAEAMIEAGIEMGLTKEISKGLTLQTIFGAGKMLLLRDEEATELRKKVTSKGGTTEAAINYFDEKKLKNIIKYGIEKAKMKSIELSKI